MPRAKGLQIYLKEGLEDDDRLLALWDALRLYGRPQDTFRRMLIRGMKSMEQDGELSDRILEYVEETLGDTSDGYERPAPRPRPRPTPRPRRRIEPPEEYLEPEELDRRPERAPEPVPRQPERPKAPQAARTEAEIDEEALADIADEISTDRHEKQNPSQPPAKPATPKKTQDEDDEGSKGSFIGSSLM